MKDYIFNQISGQETYFDASGNPLSLTNQPNVNSGSALAIGVNDLLENVKHPSMATGAPTVDNDVFHVIGLAIMQADKIQYSSRNSKFAYVGEVSTAIRAGYWNPFTGSWTTEPTTTVVTYTDDVQDVYVNLIGMDLFNY